MGLHDVDQLGSALQLGHAQHDLQRDLARFALGTGQDLAVVGTELHGAVHGHGHGGCGGAGCWSGQGTVAQSHAAVGIDRSKGRFTHRRKTGAAHDDHGQAFAENQFGDDGTKGQDFVGLLQDECGGAAPVEDDFHHHAAAGTRAAPAGQGQDLASDDFSAQRMVAVDDFAAGGLHTAPKTQGRVTK